jgi:hypothetical protein
LLEWRWRKDLALVHPATGDEEITLLSKRLRPSLALYVVLIVVGWFYSADSRDRLFSDRFLPHFPDQAAPPAEGRACRQLIRAERIELHSPRRGDAGRLVTGRA